MMSALLSSAASVTASVSPVISLQATPSKPEKRFFQLETCSCIFTYSTVTVTQTEIAP